MNKNVVTTLAELRQQRAEILALAGRHQARSVAVFGSIARDALTSDSDIDFLVDFAAGYKLRDHIRLTQALRQLLGRRVEVVDRRSLRDELRASILQEALPL